MRDISIRRKNHYVSEFLLRGFATLPERTHLWEYRLLVEDSRVPEWDFRPASHLARTSDLYTIVEADDESDRMERWLDEEFESPARDAVLAVICGERLTKAQWRLLVRLYAVQFLRTPAHYIRHKDQWAAETNEALLEARDRLLPQLPRLRDIDGEVALIEGKDGFPLRYTIRREEGSRRSMHLEHVTGRKHWMWVIQQALRPAGLLGILERYRWSILIAPIGTQWFLTDNPAVCIRRNQDGTQTLDGGWGMLGSKLILPLGPRHLLYHHVGFEMPERYVKVHPLVATQLRCAVADGALRSFYSATPDTALSAYRTRKVDRERFQNEALQWKSFGREHSRAERFE